MRDKIDVSELRYLIMSRWFLLFNTVFLFLSMDAEAQPSPRELESTSSWLASQKIKYANAWVPPNEITAWSMDCSNTARWLYRNLWDQELPRTASAQYEYFRKFGKFSKAKPDAQRLAEQLKPGDFLFWINTYKPTRKPPITHVMVYLGKDAQGKMWMTGAQNSRGVGIYEFRPKAKMGGYRWFLWFRREGRFIGFARP